MPAGSLDMFIENLESHARFRNGGSRTVQLRCGSDEYGELVRQHTGPRLFRDPLPDRVDLLALRLERLNRRGRAVEHGDRIAPVLRVAVVLALGACVGRMQTAQNEIQTAEHECEAKRQSGVLHSFAEWAECVNPQMIAAYERARFPYMDLVQVYAASLLVIAEKLDKGEISGAEAQLAAATARSNFVRETTQRSPSPRVVASPPSDRIGDYRSPTWQQQQQQQILQHGYGGCTPNFATGGCL